jgi:hypothetical protein
MNRIALILYYVFFSVPLILIILGLFRTLRKLPPDYSGFFTRRLGIEIFVLAVLVFYVLLRIGPSMAPLLGFIFPPNPYYGAYGY